MDQFVTFRKRVYTDSNNDSFLFYNKTEANFVSFTVKMMTFRIYS